MHLIPFQVRLKDGEDPQGFRPGAVGTVIGMFPSQVQGKVLEVWKVIWFNYNEETGEISEDTESPAPSSHLAHELMGFVDRFEDSDDDEYEETDYDEDEEFLSNDNFTGPIPKQV